jgi:DNA-directed RNA polymerase subunit E'/Rpb7
MTHPSDPIIHCPSQTSLIETLKWVILFIKKNNKIFSFHDKSKEKNWISEKIDLDIKKNFKLRMRTPKIPNYIVVISNQNRISLHPEIVYTSNQPQLNSKKY